MTLFEGCTSALHDTTVLVHDGIELLVTLPRRESAHVHYLPLGFAIFCLRFQGVSGCFEFEVFALLYYTLSDYGLHIVHGYWYTKD